jgi:putative multicomponent Na+:H+ antiporter subunit B
MSSALSLAGQLDLLLPITALLPLTAVLLVSQGNPYQTLVLRGILGSVATLLYGLLGAPDVALTEALVGTLLSTTLYAVALRSSMVLRLSAAEAPPPESERLLRSWLDQAHLRLEWQPGHGHGRLEPGPRLVLHSVSLIDRLREQEGHELWIAGGGSLELEPPP